MLSETTEHTPHKQGGRGAKAELVMPERARVERTCAVVAQVIADGEAELRWPATPQRASNGPP